jgi:hypothetical protein
MNHPVNRAERRAALENRKARAAERLAPYQPDATAIGRAAVHPACACALCRRESFTRHYEPNPNIVAKAPQASDWGLSRL